MKNSLPEVVPSIDDLIRLCNGDMKQNAKKFCEILDINAVEEISLGMQGFQIGDQMKDMIKTTENTLNMSLFLRVVATVMPLIDLGKSNVKKFIFVGEPMKELARSFFDDAVWAEALSTAGAKHRNLYLLLSCDESGVPVKIFL